MRAHVVEQQCAVAAHQLHHAAVVHRSESPDDVDGVRALERDIEKDDVGLPALESGNGRLGRMKRLGLHAQRLQRQSEELADALLVVNDEHVGRHGILWGMQPSGRSPARLVGFAWLSPWLSSPYESARAVCDRCTSPAESVGTLRECELKESRTIACRGVTAACTCNCRQLQVAISRSRWPLASVSVVVMIQPFSIASRRSGLLQAVLFHSCCLRILQSAP